MKLSGSVQLSDYAIVSAPKFVIYPLDLGHSSLCECNWGHCGRGDSYCHISSQMILGFVIVLQWLLSKENNCQQNYCGNKEESIQENSVSQKTIGISFWQLLHLPFSSMPTTELRIPLLSTRRFPQYGHVVSDRPGRSIFPT